MIRLRGEGGHGDLRGGGRRGQSNLDEGGGGVLADVLTKVLNMFACRPDLPPNSIACL